MAKVDDDLVSRICSRFERGIAWAAANPDKRADVAPMLGREIVALINSVLGGVVAICGENTGMIIDKVVKLGNRIEECEERLSRIETLLCEIKERQEPGNGRRY